jgi:hypothetical protein
LNNNSKLVKRKDLQIFAYIWFGIFTAIGLYPLLDEGDIAIWAIILAIVFVVIALIKPIVLTSFYNIWIKFGEFIGGIISKIIMFILYFGLFTPVSIFLKILGKDLLDKKVDKSPNSYWIEREKQPESMKNQF